MSDATYLFAFGLGCDIAGAYLLARGLLRSPRAIRRRSTWGGLYPGGLLDDIEDAATARVGVGALFGGFLTQAAAYSLLLATASSSDPSVGRAMIALAAVIVPAVLIIEIERRSLRTRVDRQLVRVAREDVVANATRALPDLELLAKVADYRGDERLAGESDAAFARRSFGLAP